MRAISSEDLSSAKLTHEKLQADVAVKEAQLRMLVGRPKQKAAEKVGGKD
jgi:hypothetical protein